MACRQFNCSLCVGLARNKHHTTQLQGALTHFYFPMSLTCVFSRFGAMESISSMKMMAGAFFSASSNAFLRLLSDSPASFDMISGPLIRKKKAPGQQQALM